MSHHTPRMSATTRCANTVKTTRPTTVLLTQDLHFDRSELATLTRFLGRHESTVRVLGADGEHYSVDTEKAHEFLATLVRCTDRHTGLLTFEADADPKRLTKHERLNLVPSRQFDLEELLAPDAPSEDIARVKKDTLFTEDTWEIWDPTGTELLGRAKSYETGKHIVLRLRGEGLNAVLTKTTRTFHTV
ncbi:hypothetical protein KBX19_03500 [Corynebacterium sp. CCUG 71335]|uniref:hypothetical protein n=1 Tax=Corynebacterium sp. CCUG 71335 TaxID=2823892 RepID=UPI00210D6A00|nr:hypothetical protein [Corynebacterium sp. CCUG 71335]MCQ4620282.1 hypothetical protein [Corynebacterium sp. CCUG 71335]